MRLDPTLYYVYRYRGGKDPFETLAIVPEELFAKLKVYEDDLEDGQYVAEIAADLDSVYDYEDISSSVCDDDYDDIPDDHFIYIAVC
jgi:hypothetical protein